MKAHRLMLWMALVALCTAVVLFTVIVWQSLQQSRPVVAAVAAAVGALMVWHVAFIMRTLLWDMGRLTWKTRSRS